MKYVITQLLLLFALSLSAQFSQNITKLGQWNHTYSSTDKYNDIWGYAAGGNEYALLGGVDSFHIIKVTNPAAPVQVKSFKGTGNTAWRDIKTYSHYAYVTSERHGEGLRIYNLSSLPTTATQSLQTTAFFHRAHNLFIDTLNARLYALGARDVNGANIDLVVLSLANPANPTLLASISLPGGYVHDAYVRNNIAYCSHGYNDLWVYNMANPTSPVTLGTLVTGGYNHSSWLSLDGQKMIFCEEVPQGLEAKCADVSDLSNMLVTDNFRSALLAPTHTNSTPHNPFIKGDSVYISYYHEGFQVFNISDPNNVVQVAWYDTDTLNTNYSGWRGAWGVYPYLPSGNFIVSDIRNGLFILKFTEISIPVELSEFNAYILNNKTALNWKTESEKNTARYIIEKSTDGVDFQELTSVQAAGFASQYKATDERPDIGTNYYRLKIMDYDGKYNYSQIKTVEFGGKKGVSIFPNILKAGNDFQIIPDFEADNIDVVLMGADGKIYLEKELKNIIAGQAYPIPTYGIGNGTYFLRVSIAGFVLTEKLLFL